MSLGDKKQVPVCLYLMIGAQDVSFSIAAGQGRSRTWLKEWRIEKERIKSETVLPSLSDLIAGLAAYRTQLALAGLKTKQIYVLVADVWLAVATIPWMSSSDKSGPTQATAREYFSALGFELEPSDCIQFDDAPYEQSRLAVAYPTNLLTSLNQFATELGGSIASVLPTSIAIRQSVVAIGERKSNATAVVDEGWFALFFGGNDTDLSEVIARRTLDHGRDALAAQWEALKLRHPYLEKDVVRVPMVDLSLRSAPQKTTSPVPTPFDLIMQRSGDLSEEAADIRIFGRSPHFATRHPLNAITNKANPLMGWVISAVALVVLFVLMSNFWKSTQQLQDLTAQHHKTEAVSRNSPAAKTWTRDEVARVQAVNRAISDLNLPISRLLLALEPPRDISVAVLSFDAQSGSTDQRNVVKIIAESQTSADMTRYLAFVSDQKPYIDAVLGKHEVLESEPGQPLRFSMEARWHE